MIEFGYVVGEMIFGEQIIVAFFGNVMVFENFPSVAAEDNRTLSIIVEDSRTLVQ